MAKPKFDYNGDAFYDEIEQLAKQGQKDSEIAYALGLKFGVDLNPQVFNLPGCPIRISTDQCLFATPRSFSQLTTSFLASG